MKNNSLPKFWENFLKVKTGLPFVELSVEKLLDSHYHYNESSMHKHYEIVYVQKGEAAFEINGQKIKVAKKDFLIIKPFCAHKIILSAEQSCSLLILYFNFKNTGFSIVPLEDFLYNVGEEGIDSPIALSSVYKYEIVSALTRITKEMNSPKTDSDFLCSLKVTEIFIWLSRAMKNNWEKSVEGNAKKLKAIMESSKMYIMDNYNKEVALNDIANSVYLSPSHFARMFKSFYKVSPIQFLLSERIRKSKELLENTELKISEISSEVGFSAQQRFNEIFKKHEGMPPLEYRKLKKAD